MSKMLHKGAVGGLIVAAAVAAFVLVPEIGQVPADHPFRFQVGWMNPIFAALAAGLAVFLLLRVADRQGAHELALVLALMCLSLVLSVAPSGAPTMVHRLAFGATWTLLVLQVIWFWTHFPQPMRMDEVGKLVHDWGRGLWYEPLNDWSARAVRWTMDHAVGRVLLVLGALGFGASHALPGARYNFLSPRIEWSSASFMAAAPFGMAIILMTAMVAWTSFRLSDGRGRRQVLWILLAHLITAFLTVMLLGLYTLAALTGSPVLTALRDAVMTAYYPVGWTVTLGGYFLALFYSGAFDLRPAISHSTVYGMSIILLTLLFAGVEELVEGLVAARMDVPSGIGTWVGAATIALFLGPVRARVEDFLHRYVPALYPEEELDVGEA